MGEVTEKRPTGGSNHIMATSGGLELRSSSSSVCEQNPRSPECRQTRALAKNPSRRVYEFAVKVGGNEVEKWVRSDEADSSDDPCCRWGDAQRKMETAYRVHKGFIQGLGEALKNGKYDSTRRTFPSSVTAVVEVRCKADTRSAITELTLLDAKDKITIETTDPEDLIPLQGRLKCGSSDNPNAKLQFPAVTSMGFLRLFTNPKTKV